MPKLGIVIPILNQFQLAIEMIASIKTSYSHNIYPILNYKENLPLAGAWNNGCIKAIEDKCEYILIINDDILFAPNTIDRMIEFMDKRQDYHWTNVLMVTGINERGSMEPGDILNYRPDDSGTLIADNPDFACFMIDDRTLDIVGPFDENFNPAYFEDNDYHRRIALSGNRAVTLHQAPYYHYGSQTQNADPNNPVVPSFVFEVNRLYYLTKWGGDVGTERFTTPFDDPTKTFKDW